MYNEKYLPKNSVPVRVTLVNDSSILGVVYLRQGQRVIDMLDDDRTFFPLKANGSLCLVNKSNVLQVDVMTLEEIEEKQELFPDVDKRYLQSNVW